MDWAKLEHAYGSAADLPVLLERIAQGSAAAVDKLGNRIAHQGWLSPEAALAAVLPLAGLVDATSGKTRASLLVLLADLSCAGSHEHFLGTGFAEDNPTSEVLAAAECQAVRQAVVAVAGGMARHLEDGSAQVRGAAALLLAVTGQGREALTARVAREKSDQARADQLIALGWLGVTPPSPRQDLTHANPVVRAGAALASGYLGPLDGDVERSLMEALALPDVRGGAWARGQLARHSVAVLRHRAAVDDRTDLVVAAFDRVDPMQRAALGSSLVKQVFAREIAALGEGRRALTAPSAAAPPPLDALTAAQRDALTLLCRYESGWGGSSDQAYWLKKLGFRASPPALSRYLGAPPPPPDVLDREVDWRGGTQTIRELLPKVCLPEDFVGGGAAARAVSATLSPAEALAALRLVNQSNQVPSFFCRFTFGVHLVLAQGEEMVPHLVAELARIAVEGNPSWWGHNDERLMDTHLPAQCAAALVALDPSANLPSTAISETVQVSMEGMVSRLDAETAAMVHAGLGRAGIRAPERG